MKRLKKEKKKTRMVFQAARMKELYHTLKKIKYDHISDWRR